jgi:drug/metabolite transporter (DMT)-like permease
MKNKKIWLLTLLAGAAGGTIPAFSKIALQSMSPGDLTILRYAYTLVALFLLGYARREKINWRQVKRTLPISVLAAINAMSFAVGVQHLQAASIQLLVPIVPLIVAVLSWIILKQRTSLDKIIGLIIGLAGVTIVALAPIFVSAGHVSFSLFGTGIVLFGLSCYALYSVLSKPIQERATPSEVLVGASLTTIACQFVISLTTHGSLTLSHMSLRSFFASLIVGLIGTTLLYWLYQYIIKVGTPLLASLNLYIQPFFGTFFAFVVISDHLSLLTIIGGLIALAGVAQVNGLWKNFKR